VTPYVVDASVAAKWFLPPETERYTVEAGWILADHAAGRRRILVPDLFWSELGDILWKAARLGRMPADTAAKAVRSLEQTRIPTSSSMPLLRSAFGIATEFGRTFYDSIYVALALASGSYLLTADERLVNALSGRFPIRWLGSSSHEL
jgi:predicted nucleic acid-binding protein